jgi:hypothetical protein
LFLGILFFRPSGASIFSSEGASSPLRRIYLIPPASIHWIFQVCLKKRGSPFPLFSASVFYYSLLPYRSAASALRKKAADPQACRIICYSLRPAPISHAAR